MRLFLLVRHGQSLFNVGKVVNGDPALDRGLSEQGIEEAERLAGQLAALPVTTAFHATVAPHSILGSS